MTISIIVLLIFLKRSPSKSSKTDHSSKFYNSWKISFFSVFSKKTESNTTKLFNQAVVRFQGCNYQKVGPVP